MKYLCHFHTITLIILSIYARDTPFFRAQANPKEPEMIENRCIPEWTNLKIRTTDDTVVYIHTEE